MLQIASKALPFSKVQVIEIYGKRVFLDSDLFWYTFAERGNALKSKLDVWTEPKLVPNFLVKIFDLWEILTFKFTISNMSKISLSHQVLEVEQNFINA